MDKIITINLGGYAIKMEEDAYEALKLYIRQIEEKFANTENGKEIINDIEARIAEMLMERTEKKVAASIEDVDYIKKAMGNPGEFEENESDEQTSRFSIPNDSIRKRLYRDTDNKLLGGVCAGLSNYFNIDPSIVRLIWIGSLFFFGTGLLIYFIMWVVVPEAITTAQKLEMRGEAPTFDNIINRVKNEAGKVEQNIKSQNFGQRIADIFSSLGPVFKTVFKMFALALGVLILIALLAVFFALISGGTNFMFTNQGVSLSHLPNVFDSEWQFMTFRVLIGLFICIPLFMILTSLLKFIFSIAVNFRPIRRILGWIWVLTIPFLVYFFVLGIKNSRTYETISTEHSVKINKPITIKGEFGDNTNLFDCVSINIQASQDSLLYITTLQSANGKSTMQAREFAGRNGAKYVLNDSELVLKTGDYFKKNGIYRHQKVEFTILIPNGKSFIIDRSILGNAIGINVSGNNVSYFAQSNDVKNIGLLFLNQNLYCPSCPDSIPYGSSGVMNFLDFKKIEVENMIEVEIHRGNSFRIQKVGPADIISHLEINQYNETLILEMEDDYFNLRTKPKVIITMPQIESLKLSGIASCKMDSFAGNTFYFEGNGASHADMKMDFAEIKVEMSGTSSLGISGNTKVFDIDISGAAQINSEKMSLDVVDVNQSGVSKVILGISKSVHGEVSGASELEYLGLPTLKVENSGVSKIRPFRL